MSSLTTNITWTWFLISMFSVTVERKCDIDTPTTNPNYPFCWRIHTGQSGTRPMGACALMSKTSGCGLTLIHGLRMGPDLRNLGKSEWIWCHDVMVEAGKPRWLHLTFTLYIYKVFEHLKMLWIGSWMRPYTDTPAEGGPRNWEIGVSLSEYNAMMSWLRLVSPADCIPLSHYIYIKCLSTLRCCG